MQHLSYDKHLLDSCIKGDREAQRVLYDRLASRMFPVCIRYVGDRTLAEDVLQEVFLTAFQKFPQLKNFMNIKFSLFSELNFRKLNFLTMNFHTVSVRQKNAFFSIANG